MELMPSADPQPARMFMHILHSFCFCLFLFVFVCFFFFFTSYKHIKPYNYHFDDLAQSQVLMNPNDRQYPTNAFYGFELDPNRAYLRSQQTQMANTPNQAAPGINSQLLQSGVSLQVWI